MMNTLDRLLISLDRNPRIGTMKLIGPMPITRNSLDMRAEILVAPRQGLYTPSELQELMSYLINQSKINPSKITEFEIRREVEERSEKMILGSLLIEEAIGTKMIGVRTEDGYLRKRLNEKGDLGLGETDITRATLLRLLPSVQYLMDLVAREPGVGSECVYMNTLEEYRAAENSLTLVSK